MKKSSLLSKHLPKIALVLLSPMLISVLSCNGKKESGAKVEVRTITVAHRQDGIPYSWVDEKGQPTGYEYEIFRSLEAELPQYKFEYISTTQEDALIGLDTGRNQVVLSGLFKNPLREKKYGIPKNPESATVTGFAVNRKFESKLKGFNREDGYSDISTNNLKLAPVNSSTGLYGIVLEYNEKNPDKKLTFETNSTRFSAAEQLDWLVQGRYDAVIFNEHNFYRVADSDKKYTDNFLFVPTYSIGVYPLFNKKDTQLLADYEAAFERIYKNGTVAKLQEKYFGKDVLSLLRDVEKIRFDSNESVSSTVRKITVAHRQNDVPYSYIGEDGKATGYEYDLFHEIDKILPQYEFTYVGTEQADALLGLDAGRNQVVISGMFKNPAREKKYGIPKNPDSATVTGFFVDKKFESKLKGFNKENGYTDIADNNLRLATISSAGGLFGIINDYNEKNPEKQVKFETTSNSVPVGEALSWVLQGRFDAALMNEHNFNLVVYPNGKANLQYADKLIYVPTYSIGVWPFFNKSETKLIEDYNKAFEELYKNGTVERLQKKYFGKDVLSLLRDKEKIRFD